MNLIKDAKHKMGLLKHNFTHDIDSPARTLEHRNIILNNSFLKKLYQNWYESFAVRFPTLPSGKIIELGSGGGFLKEYCPNTEIICSDVIDLPTNDMTFSALNLPFQDDELAAILMIDTFHHIPDSQRFLEEASRTLTPGGKIIMVEPANSWWGRMIFSNFHSEPFITDADWFIPAGGPMSGANIALPWIVFQRDVQKFTKLFPNLEISSITYHTPLRYLISGGVSFKQLVPTFTFNFFSWLECVLLKLDSGFSMFVTLEVTKK